MSSFAHEEDQMNRETWQFINTFAPWFSALGTIFAVIISLRLAAINGVSVTFAVPFDS